jgi:hypothetical protein
MEVNLYVAALQSMHYETQRLPLQLHTRRCRFESVSGSVSVVFVYKSSLKMAAPLSKCTVVEQRAVIRLCGQNALKHLKPAMRKNSRGLLSKWVLLLHDNAGPHSAAATTAAIRQLKFELLPHPHIVRT